MDKVGECGVILLMQSGYSVIVLNRSLVKRARETIVMTHCCPRGLFRGLTAFEIG